MQYTSTYQGLAQDSDDDEHHITMPFTHGDDVHHQILYDREFESDESYEMEGEEKDKLLSTEIKTQNSVLDTMQRTITKMSKALKPQSREGQKADFSFADTF